MNECNKWIFLSLKICFIVALYLAIDSRTVHACWDPDASEAFDNNMDGWEGHDYEWGKGHSYNNWNTYGSDWILDNWGCDCSGMINIDMWDRYGSSWNSSCGNVVSEYCEDDYWTDYDIDDYVIWEGDIVVSSSGGHIGELDSVRGELSIDMRHAAGNQSGGWRDEIVVDTCLNPYTDSRWGQDNGAIYKGLTPP